VDNSATLKESELRSEIKELERKLMATLETVKQNSVNTVDLIKLVRDLVNQVYKNEKKE
jgi:hypothetical protein